MQRLCRNNRVVETKGSIILKKSNSEEYKKIRLLTANEISARAVLYTYFIVKMRIEKQITCPFHK